MKKIIYLILTTFLVAEISLAAGGDESSSSSSSSNSSSYGSSNKKVDVFYEVKTLIRMSKFKEAHSKLKDMSVGVEELKTKPSRFHRQKIR